MFFLMLSTAVLGFVWMSHHRNECFNQEIYSLDLDFGIDSTHAIDQKRISGPLDQRDRNRGHLCGPRRNDAESPRRCPKRRCVKSLSKFDFPGDLGVIAGG